MVWHSEDIEMSIEDFAGWRFRQLALPDGGKIVCFFFQPQGVSDVSLHDINHNIFRLSPSGEVLWQVQRDDSIHPPGWWDKLHARARAKGLDGERWPFMYFTLELPDGTRKPSDHEADGTGIELWAPGIIIHLYGIGLDYVLDPETGIAKNVESGPKIPGGRVW